MVDNPFRDKDVDPLWELGRIQLESIDIAGVVRHCDHPKEGQNFFVGKLVDSPRCFQRGGGHGVICLFNELPNESQS